ncbi:MAG: LCP family protein [Clostridia bacterium]|nr:LCP family protein [Clostridia bacterium]
MAKNAMRAKRLKKTLIPILCFVLVLVLLVGGACFAFFRYLGKIERVDPAPETIPPELEFFETDAPPSTEVITEIVTSVNSDGSVVSSVVTVATEPPSAVIAPEEITWEDIAAIGDDELLNIMLVGQDRRPGEVRTRSDVMMLCSINPKTGEVSLVSFLRDLYVQIPGYSDNRLNQAYFFGGFPLLYDAMNQNFGITIDGGFEVDFEGFVGVVDTLGGVDIELTAAEANYLGGGLVAGVNHLSGEQALAYSRIRALDNDWGRTSRQRTVMEAILNKFRNSDLSTVVSLVNEVLPMLTTDMSNADILSLAKVLVPVAKNMEINTYSVPASDCYSFANIRGMEVLLPDLPRIRNYLETEYLPLSK